jgi:hypothetical protein
MPILVPVASGSSPTEAWIKSQPATGRNTELRKTQKLLHNHKDLQIAGFFPYGRETHRIFQGFSAG